MFGWVRDCPSFSIQKLPWTRHGGMEFIQQISRQNTVQSHGVKIIFYIAFLPMLFAQNRHTFNTGKTT